MKSVVIIPARYNSSRLPGKPLVRLIDKPMIIWVAELSEVAVGKENVYVATDDSVIADIVTQAGFNVIITSSDCLTGTDRVAEAANQIEADIYINVQGDEPLVNPQDIIKIIKTKEKHYDDIINGYCQLEVNENPNNTNIPKVIFNQSKSLVYISRLAIPGFKNKNQVPKYYKQVCIYAFNLKELNTFVTFKEKTDIEKSEDIEITRFFETSINIRMVETSLGSAAVDVPKDVLKVENELIKRNNV